MPSQQVMEQAPLFEISQARALKKQNANGHASWRPLNSDGRVQCEDCVLVAHSAWPDPVPPIRQATWTRITRHGTRVLCEEHAGHWR